MEHELVSWLLRFGAPLLFFAQALGIFGVPIPDELLLTIAGALVAKGLLSPHTTVLAAIAGCLTGITASYMLGRGVGVALARVGWLHHNTPLDRAEAAFRRFGGWMLTFGYFIPGVRHATAIVAGSSELTYKKFAAYAYPGGVLWCSVFLSLGYYAGDRWRQVFHVASAHVTIIALVLAGLIGVYVLLRLRGDSSNSQRERQTHLS